jgi:glycosyltransferase involved in cell wall biosynthesis
MAPAGTGDRPGGTGIRALELARALSAVADVSLAVEGEAPETVAGLPCTAFARNQPGALEAPAAAADVVIATPHWPRVTRILRRSGARIVFDLYVPEALELLPGFPGQSGSLRRVLGEYAVDRVVDALRTGHQFICASERQRDLWLGVMLAERLLDPARHDHDPSLRSLVDVVAFGIPEEPPAQGPSARDRFDAIGPEDEVILWNGGIWPWLDAPTAIRAMPALLEGRPSARLVFMGAAHQVPARRATEQAVEVAEALGLLGTHVLFNDEWVPYADRGGWLLGAACAVSCHRDQPETRFSFRTRLLDCLWARLPVVCTAGDDLGDLVERRELGGVVPPGDPAAVAAALERVLANGREEYAGRLGEAAGEYTWPRVAARLAEMIAAPAPPRPSRRALRPAHSVRRSAYLRGRALLDLVGVRDWPRV